MNAFAAFRPVTAFLVLLLCLSLDRDLGVAARRRSHPLPHELRASLFDNDLGLGLGQGVVFYDDGIRALPPPLRSHYQLAARSAVCVPTVNPSPSALTGDAVSATGTGGVAQASGAATVASQARASYSSRRLVLYRWAVTLAVVLVLRIV